VRWGPTIASTEFRVANACEGLMAIGLPGTTELQRSARNSCTWIAPVREEGQLSVPVVWDADCTLYWFGFSIPLLVSMRRAFSALAILAESRQYRSGLCAGLWTIGRSSAGELGAEDKKGHSQQFWAIRGLLASGVAPPNLWQFFEDFIRMSSY